MVGRRTLGEQIKAKSMQEQKFQAMHEAKQGSVMPV
jgi:hypothetical protein